MGSVIDREINNLHEACDELMREGGRQGLNAFFGSAISFKRFPNFVDIRDDVSMAILNQMGVYKKIFQKEANKQRLRTEASFEALWRALDRQCFQVFTILANSVPLEPEINHYLIAQLREAGVFRSLITTNWDSYIEIALERLPDLYSVKSAMKRKRNPPVKLHGDLNIPSSLVFTESDLTKKLAREARRYLTDSITKRPTIIIGYSGNDHDVLEALRQGENPQPIYWLCYDKGDAKHLKNVWSTYDGLPPLRLIAPKARKRGAPLEIFDLTKLLKKISSHHRLRVDFIEKEKEFDRTGFQQRLSNWSSELPSWRRKLAAAHLFREINATSHALAFVQSAEKETRTGSLYSQMKSKVTHASILWEAQPRSRQALKIAASVIKTLESKPQAKYRTLLLGASDNAAMALFRMGKLDEAYAVCKHGLSLKPSDPALRNTLGAVLYEMNRFEEALQEFEHVIRVARRRGRYSMLMDALNLKSLALPEVAKGESFSMKERIDKQLECEATRSELERIARIAKSKFYQGCALINSAEDLHLRGNMLAALEKATEAFEIDYQTNPEDPDAAVTCEIVARILLDVGVIWYTGKEFQELMQDVERIIAVGLRVVGEVAEERACLHALRAVYLAEMGSFAEATKVMKRSLAYSLRYKKRGNLAWAYIQKARIQGLQNQWKGAAMSLDLCGDYVKNNPMRELYFYCQKMIHLLWTPTPSVYREIPLEDVRQFAAYLGSQATTRACGLAEADGRADKHSVYPSWNRADLLRSIYGSLDKKHLGKLILRIRDTYHSWQI